LVALVLVAGAGLGVAPRAAYANKVDCDKVMAEKAAGKKTKEIASDLKISTSSVYRCKEKAGAKGKMAPAPAASATPKK
jgi:transposase